jgi:hypothetical protein
MEGSKLRVIESSWDKLRVFKLRGDISENGESSGGFSKVSLKTKLPFNFLFIKKERKTSKSPTKLPTIYTKPP